MSMMTTIFTKNEEVQFSVRDSKLMDKINTLTAIYYHIKSEYGEEDICLNKLWNDEDFIRLLYSPHKFLLPQRFSFADIQKIGLGKTYKNIYGDRKFTGTKILADKVVRVCYKSDNIKTFEGTKLTTFGHTVEFQQSEKTSPLTYLLENGVKIKCYRQVPLFLLQRYETVDITTDYGTVNTTVTYVRLNPDFLKIAEYMMDKCMDYLANREKYKAISLIKQVFNYCNGHGVKFEEAFEEYVTNFWDGERS